MTTPKAALYLRSSKDRSDVSIDAQRRELQKHATERGILVVREYADVVESAKDEHRPAFQQLLRDLKDAQRGWNTLMLVDTSRLSRRRYMAQVFKHEAAKRGVKIIYSKIPESDPIVDMVIVGVLEVFDELHSLMSKDKGLAGMAENVRQGFRAGGRAPKGYRLKHISTGAVRDGEQVMKSVLEPSEEAPLIARYLKARAAGRAREPLRRELGLDSPVTSLIGIEWNALTYAGHTVWNVHNEFGEDGYKGGTKRKPRDQWVIQRNTHEALITDAEAEALLAALEQSTHGKRRRTAATYLLTGLLKTPAGDSWYGDGNRHYRTKPKGGRSRWVEMDELEGLILGQIASDLASAQFVRS